MEFGSVKIAANIVVGCLGFLAFTRIITPILVKIISGGLGVMEEIADRQPIAPTEYEHGYVGDV